MAGSLGPKIAFSGQFIANYRVGDFRFATNRLSVARLLCSFRKIHVRSPELFDELVLADGKKEAWAPRANKITGQWFDQIKSVKDVYRNLLLLKSEDGSVVSFAVRSAWESVKYS